MTLPLIAPPRAAPAAWPALFRRPWLVIAGRRDAVAAAQHRAARVIGLGRAGQVRLVRLLPGIALARLRHLVDHVVQPGVPLRRHLGTLRLAIVDDPAPLAARPPAAAPDRLIALEAIVAVAVGVGADGLAAQPGQQPCSKRRAH